MEMSSEKAAAAAGLCYTHDDMSGIRRKPWGQGFSYVMPAGDRLDTDPTQGSSDWKLRDRIEKLAIPPNWSDVWICLSPNGHLQATGRDDKARKQYRYHADWRKFRNIKKFDRMVPFGETLPTLRLQTEVDLKRKSLSRRKVAATAVHLLDRTLIRVGNTQYAKKNQSYGVTTGIRLVLRL